MKKNIYNYKNACDVTSELFQFDNFVDDLMNVFEKCLYNNVDTHLFKLGIEIFNDNLGEDTTKRFINFLAFSDTDSREEVMFELLNDYYNDIMEYANNQLKKFNMFYGMDTTALISKCYLFTNKVYYGYYYNLDDFDIIKEWSFDTLYDYLMSLHNDEKVVYDLMIRFYEDNANITSHELEKILEDMDAKIN